MSASDAHTCEQYGTSSSACLIDTTQKVQWDFMCTFYNPSVCTPTEYIDNIIYTDDMVCNSNYKLYSGGMGSA